jgi:hypothetical protein
VVATLVVNVVSEVSVVVANVEVTVEVSVVGTLVVNVVASETVVDGTTELIVVV